jgi:hypothetical protein
LIITKVHGVFPYRVFFRKNMFLLDIQFSKTNSELPTPVDSSKLNRIQTSLHFFEVACSTVFSLPFWSFLSP